jgi:hypothetical protein
LPQGLEGAAPDILPITGLGAVAGSISNAAPEDDRDNLRRHMLVLQALMSDRAVVPARFGSVFTAREELNDYVSESRDMFLADLDRVRGHIEMSLRVVNKRPLSPASTGEHEEAGALPASMLAPGAGYLAARRAETASRAKRIHALENLASTVSRPLSSIATSCKWRAAPSLSGAPAISVALLLRRDRLGAFRLKLAELRQSEPWLEFISEGPLPPYSFVNGAPQIAPDAPIRCEEDLRLFG